MAHFCVVEPVFILNQKNHFGSFLVNSLNHQSKVIEENHKYSLTEKGIQLMIVIPEYYANNYGLNITIGQQYWFNKFIQAEFINHMLMYVAPRIKGRKGDILKALLKYRNTFGIFEDDLPIRTLQKMWERNRHRIPCFMLN